jgi:Fic/DOC family
VKKLNTVEPAAGANGSWACQMRTLHWIRGCNRTEADRISTAAQRAGLDEARAWAAAGVLGTEVHAIPRLLSTIEQLRALETLGPATTASERQSRISALRDLTTEHAAVRIEAEPTATSPSEIGLIELRNLFNRPVPDTVQRSMETRWAAIDATRTRLSRQIDFKNPNHPETRQLHEALQRSRMQLSRSHYPQTVGQDVAVRSIDNWLGVERAVTQMAGRGEKLSLDHLKSINQSLGSGISLGTSSAGEVLRYGEYRTQTQGPVGAGQRQYLDPRNQNIEQAMNDFMGWLQSAEQNGMHPVQIASQAYMRLTSIHPFPDANGRTARLAMNWILQSHGYPPAGLEPEHMNRIFARESVSVVPEPGAAEQEVTTSIERSLSVAEAQVRR